MRPSPALKKKGSTQQHEINGKTRIFRIDEQGQIPKKWTQTLTPWSHFLRVYRNHIMSIRNVWGLVQHYSF